MKLPHFEVWKITRPFQLLAASLIALIWTSYLLLKFSTIIKHPIWGASLLAIAALVNIPIFLIFIFLLLVKYRTQLMADHYYQKFIENRANDYSEEKTRTKDLDEKVITPDNVLEALRYIPDVRDIDKHYRDAHFWFLKYGVVTNTQLNKLIKSEYILDILRDLYRDEMPWRDEMLLDPLAISVWGSMLFIDGANDIVLETIRKKLRSSKEYIDHHD